MSQSSIEIGAVSQRWKFWALLAGPLLGLLTYWLLPEHYASVTSPGVEVPFSYEGKACLGVTVWMAVWWFTEALPIAATALLPLMAYPILQITTPQQAMVNYASSTIFLFLGGFLLAAGIHRWHLDRRIALLTLKFFGTKPSQMILGLMTATAFLSAWVSNTATVAMMVPIAISVLGVIRSAQTSETPSIEEKNFGIAVLLAIAFSASIGGMATLIGSPPNGIFVRFMEQTYGQTITFTEWMTVALPIVACLMPACYLLLTKVIFPCKIDGIPGGREWVRDELLKLGDMTRGEKVVLAVFASAALMWIFGPWIRGFEIDGARPFAPFRDEIIAMCAGMALFVLPVDIDRHIHALDWQSAKDVVAWDVLLLFGGGLTMAAAIQSTGAASLIGAQAASFAGLGEIPMIAGVASLVAVATEMTSNTALAATMMPLIAAAAESLNMNPEALLYATVLATSCAFMMPVATPPNAIIFSTGRIRIIDMLKAGVLLDIFAVMLITVVVKFL